MCVRFNLHNIQSMEKNRTGTPQGMAADRGAKGADAAALLRQRLHFVTSDTKCCLLYTSDAADDLLCVDLGGRRIIKKKKTHNK